MLYTKEQVLNGIASYLDDEVMSKLPTHGKWIMGTAIALSRDNISEILNNPYIKMLGIVNADGLWDVDKLASALKATAERYGNIQLDLPIIGRLTFSAEDVDLMRRHIN